MATHADNRWEQGSSQHGLWVALGVLCLGLSKTTTCLLLPQSKEGWRTQKTLAPSSSLHGLAKPMKGKIKIHLPYNRRGDFPSQMLRYLSLCWADLSPCPSTPAAQVFIKKLPRTFFAAPNSRWHIFLTSGYDSASPQPEGLLQSATLGQKSKSLSWFCGKVYPRLCLRSAPSQQIASRQQGFA